MTIEEVLLNNCMNMAGEIDIEMTAKAIRQHFLEQLPKEFPMANDKSDDPYDGGWNDCLKQIKQSLGLGDKVA